MPAKCVLVLSLKGLQTFYNLCLNANVGDSVNINFSATDFAHTVLHLIHLAQKVLRYNH
jgi:hypothetical protein